jgi:hypothetical protein
VNLGNLPVNTISLKDTLPTAIATTGCTTVNPTLSGLSNGVTVSSVTAGTTTCPNASATATFGNLPNVTGGSLPALRGGEFTYDVKLSSTANHGTAIANNAVFAGQDIVSNTAINKTSTSNVTIEALDYGDAPDTYGTDKTANNSSSGNDPVGASHGIISTLKLGTNTPDFEPDAQAPLDGTGDGADEDAFTTLPNVPTIGNYNLTVPLRNTSGGAATLHAWIDFNKNGKFEVGEYKSAAVANAATSANLSWAVPSGTTAGDTYVRFRLTTTALTDNTTTTNQDERSIGAANNGEVEDYKVAITSPISPLAGQLIINEVLYAQSTSGNIGADKNDEFIELFNASNNTIDLSGFKLIDGNLLVSVTNDPNALDGITGSITGNQSPYVFPNGTSLQSGQYAVIWIGKNIPGRSATGAAFQDWLNTAPSLNNDGDDVWLYDANTKLIDYMSYGLTSSNAINTRPDASLNFWDSTHENKLDGATLGQSISLTPNGVDGNKSHCWEKTALLNNDSDSASGRCTGFKNTIDTDIAFISSNQRITSVGKNNNQIIQDFGDVPTDYENNNSARHALSTNLHLGNVFPDAETAAQSSANANGDDAVAAPNLDDEDGVSTFPTLKTDSTNYNLTTTVSNPSGVAAKVYAWIDFDRDREFDQDERATIVNTNATTDTVTLNWNINVNGNPGANVINGSSYLRIRVTTDNLDQAAQTTTRDDASIGAASNGEIEDYPLEIEYSSPNKQSYCESIGGTLNPTNLFTEADNGTFGVGTAENESSALSPSNLTTYTYQANYPPLDGQYTVSTRLTQVGFETWHTLTGHTTGSITDKFMVINANQEKENTEMLQSNIVTGLTPNTNYTFTAYILCTGQKMNVGVARGNREKVS